ncbi:MAG: ATP-dependent helicase RecG, partial [Deinococcus sp.]|nr:ATP-dependent helicase RecG [Deinococcus sp.]
VRATPPPQLAEPEGHPLPPSAPAARPARAHKPTQTDGPSAAEVRAVALALAREQGSVRNVELRAACALTPQQSWRVLRRLVQDGLLLKRGVGKRDAAYVLA